MNVEELTELIAPGESETLEFKRTTGQRTRAMETLCAMLNGKGGSVVFGVADSGQLNGQEISPATLRQVQAELARIQPAPFADVETVRIGKGGWHALVVTVPGRTGVYTFDGRAYVRQGPTTARMAKEQYERLLLEQNHGARRWEKLPAPGFEPGDLDTAEILRTVDEAVRRDRLEDPGSRDPRQLLLGMGLIEDDRLLNAAIVLFGKPDAFLPSHTQCLLKMARFAGTDKDEFLDNRQEHGNAFDLFVRAQRFLRDHLPVASRFEPDRYERTDIPIFPTAAVREALANAICHRDYASGAGSVDVALYADRLEITNTGTLHFGMTVADLGRVHKSMPWNPLIAQAFYRRGIIETWGRGTLKIQNLMQAAGLPPPEFDVTDQAVTVRFFPGGKKRIWPERVGLPEETQEKVDHDGAHDGVHDGVARASDQKEQQPQSQPQSQPRSQPRSQLREKILALLQDGELSTGQLSLALGQQQRGGHLRETLRKLHQEGLIAFTLPGKPSSRLQKHRLTERGRKAGSKQENKRQ